MPIPALDTPSRVGGRVAGQDQGERLVYGSAEVAQATGVTVHQLRRWLEDGVVRATAGEHHPGRGRMRLWRHDDVVVVRAVATLVAAKVPLSDIRKAFSAIVSSRPGSQLPELLSKHALIAVRGGPIIGAIPREAKDSLLPLADLVVVEV